MTPHPLIELRNAVLEKIPKKCQKCKAMEFYLSTPHFTHSSQQSEQPKFNSTDLLLLANDEWKRREERRHNHEHIPWTAGFINGFLTDKKWAREYIDKLRSKQGEQQ